MKRLRPLSHSLSKVLRHSALDMGFTMTPDGFVRVDEILKHSKFRNKYSLADIQLVVKTSDKQRFKLEERTIDGQEGTVLCIRANQGHSISLVDPNLLLCRLEPAELETIPLIVHGTYQDAWQSIQKQGLKRMTRNHIHCAPGLPAQDGVISGMRKSCDIYIYINARKCAADGVTFFRSENNVLLTAGVNEEGTLPVEYFDSVTDKFGNVLMSGT